MINHAAEQSRDRGLRFKIVIVWLAILLLSSFWLTVKGSSDPVSMAIIPQVPRQGEPVIVILKLNNPSREVIVTSYQFYANGELLREGTTSIIPGFGKTYKYVFENPVPLGEALNFAVRIHSEQGHYEQTISTPPYPPQIWSSFVSFASFSTSVMGFLSTMSYYQSAFGSGVGFNVGIIFAVILIALLIFLELSQPLLEEKTILVLGNLRLRFNTITWLLLIIFLGIVYTKLVMILTG